MCTDALRCNLYEQTDPYPSHIVSLSLSLFDEERSESHNLCIASIHKCNNHFSAAFLRYFTTSILSLSLRFLSPFLKERGFYICLWRRKCTCNNGLKISSSFSKNSYLQLLHFYFSLFFFWLFVSFFVGSNKEWNLAQTDSERILCFLQSRNSFRNLFYEKIIIF